MGKAWQDGDLVSCTEVSSPIDARNFLGRIYYPLLIRAGLPRLQSVRVEAQRRGLLLEAGVHPRVVAERLGHATERMQAEATTALERTLSA